LDNDVKASGFTKELEKQFEQVSDTIGLRADVENGEQFDEEDEHDIDDNEESEDEQVNTLSSNLSKIIANNNCSLPAVDEFCDNDLIQNINKQATVVQDKFDNKILTKDETDEQKKEDEEEDEDEKEEKKKMRTMLMLKRV